MNRHDRSLLADLEKAFDEGKSDALDAGRRRSFYSLCENGKWLDAAWYAGYDAGVAQLKRTARALARHVDKCPWDPPEPAAITADISPPPKAAP